MKINKELLASLLLRESFQAFVERCFFITHGQKLELNWHHKVLISELENCRLGKTKRLVANLPPRHLKSEICSIFYPLWVLAHEPAKQIIIITHSKKLGIFWLQNIKLILENSLIKALFPKLQIKNYSLDKIQTTANGSIVVNSTRNSIIGVGADIFIIDDPISIRDAEDIDKIRTVNRWFKEELLTRMNSKENGVIILAMQRVHTLDLSAFVLHTQKPTHINIPALNKNQELWNWQAWNILKRKFVAKSYTRIQNEPIQESRESLQILKKIKSDMGGSFETQYQQKPCADVKNQEFICKIKDFEPLPITSKIGRLFINFKISNNQKKIQCLVSFSNEKHHKYIYILDYFEENFDKTKLEELVIKTHEKYLNYSFPATNGRYSRPKLQIALSCKLIENIDEFSKKLLTNSNNFRIKNHVFNDLNLSKKLYQDVINHMFVDEVDEAKFFIKKYQFIKKLESSLSPPKPSMELEFLVEAIGVHR